MGIPKFKTYMFLLALLMITIFFFPFVAFADDDADSSSDTWTGFYFGGNAGAGAFTGLATDWGYAIFDGPQGDFDLTNFNKLMGAQAGYNRQIGNMLYGVEADWAWVSYEEEKVFDLVDHFVRPEMDWLSTVRARLGLAVGNGLAYITGGLAIADMAHCANNNEPCTTDGNNDIRWEGTNLGLVAGAGIEARLSESWSLKGEYLYVKMAQENVVYDEMNFVDIPEDIDFSHRSHILRVGLNYHFNGLPIAGTIGSGPWSGFYAGAHGGVGAFTGMTVDWGSTLFSDPSGDVDLNAFASLVGMQAGYNFQHGNVVYGLEVDGAWTGFEKNESMNEEREIVHAEVDWLATVRTRLGLAVGNGMAYITGGLAIANLEHCANENNLCSVGPRDVVWDEVSLGMVGGAGIEAQLAENWSVKGEYLYMQMGKHSQLYPASANREVEISNQTHLIRVGLNHHFNGLPLIDTRSSGQWSGFYGGAHTGAGDFTGLTIDYGGGIFDNPSGDHDLDEIAALAGLQAGYNFQNGNVVYGLEVDGAWTGFGKNRFSGAFRENFASAEMDWLATARARLGLAVGNALAYVTGGLALAEMEHCVDANAISGPLCWEGANLGMTAGAGVEVKLADNLSLKGEFLFVKMGEERVQYEPDPIEDIIFSNRSKQARIGLNYYFGG